MRLNSRSVLAAVTLCVLGTCAAGADTYYVDGTCGDDAWTGTSPVCQAPDGPKATIQAGINAAGPGDEVIVADGVYRGTGNRNLDFGGKDLVLRSAHGAAACILDCEGFGRAFYFHSGETSAAALIGFTVTNGSTDWGGGILCDDSSPTIADCTIRRCVNAGVCIAPGAAPVLTRCLIWGNSGSGVRAFGAATLRGCIITCNRADNGACVHSENGTIALRSCLITRNHADRRGGGLYLYGGTVMLTNCTVARNRAAANGAVEVAYTAQVSFTSCVVWHNMPDQMMGGQGTAVTYSAVERDYVWPGEGNINIDPQVSFEGYLLPGSPCIDAGDPNGDYTGQQDVNGESRVLGGRVDMGADELLDSDTDALPDWWEITHFADPTAADPLADTDFDGVTELDEFLRGSNPLVPPTTYFVDVAGDDAWDGRAPQWNGTHGPKATLRAALECADRFEGDTIQLAPGTYLGDGNRDLILWGKRVIIRSVDPSDPAIVDATVIDCQATDADRHRALSIMNGEPPETTIAGLTFTRGVAPVDFYMGMPVLPCGGAILCAGASILLDRCVFRDNQACIGGAVYWEDGDPAIVGCTLESNAAHSYTPSSVTWLPMGGALAVDNGALTLTGCRFLQNAANSIAFAWGGAVDLASVRATIQQCEFRANTIQSTGGASNQPGLSGAAIRCTSANNGLPEVWLADSLFADNRIIGPDGRYKRGGGLSMTLGALTAERCRFQGNSTGALGWGGALFLPICPREVTLRECEFTGNQAEVGSALAGGCEVSGCTFAANRSPGGAALKGTNALFNCIVWNPGAESDGIGTVSYCNIEGGSPGIGNIDADPAFVDLGHWDDNGTPSDPYDDLWTPGDYGLAAGSPCINAGTHYAAPLPLSDLDGYARVQQCRVDLGALESPYPPQTMPDCNGNGLDDDCEIHDGTAADCNTNHIPDECDIAGGSSSDNNGNGIPDECETCPGDANCDGVVSWRDIDHFVAAMNDNLAAWQALFAPGGPTCPFANNDVNADGTVSWRDIDPLVAAMNTLCP